MKRTLLFLVPAFAIILLSYGMKEVIWGQGSPAGQSAPSSPSTSAVPAHSFPSFYKGIYLTVDSGRSTEKLKSLISRAKQSGINTFVIDVQYPRSAHCAVPKENVDLLLAHGIHPVARIVMFPDGLNRYPIEPEYIQARYRIARESCENGFREIQFDYIRFNDYSVRGKLTVAQRAEVIEGILKTAKTQLRQFNVKTAADVFGRIPLNKVDPIGQRMEGLDRVVDVICPMAYPSHYTWSKKLQADPYFTVLMTSQKANERTAQAEIVTYIQAFKMRIGVSGLTYDEYIRRQIKAVHDAGIRGFILWNARQDYEVPFAVVKSYYSGRGSETFSSAKPADGPQSGM